LSGSELRIGIVGAGLQGGRRAPVLREFPEVKLAVISSEHYDHAAMLASRVGCEAEEGLEAVVARGDLDIVVVCTPPHLHAEITIASLESGKHVLCEKPLARTENEARAMVEVARKSGKVLKCGFNHRHHPGIRQVRRWVDEGEIGDIMFLRCRYGICGRPGYEEEWRADPRIVAGGQLMEQGVHAIDLFRWFLGDPAEVSALIDTSFWSATPLEDNAFVLLRSIRGQVASLHSSLTQWKNLFSFEIFGRDGYSIVEGLGGGYGTERAVLGKRDFHAPFAEQVIEYRGEDRSWYEEWKEFLAAITQEREPLGNAIDGLRALQIANAAYAAAREGKSISLVLE
jgi:predicted dehydrogenase